MNHLYTGCRKSSSTHCPIISKARHASWMAALDALKLAEVTDKHFVGC